MLGQGSAWLTRLPLPSKDTGLGDSSPGLESGAGNAARPDLAPGLGRGLSQETLWKTRLKKEVGPSLRSSEHHGKGSDVTLRQWAAWEGLKESRRSVFGMLALAAWGRSSDSPSPL